MITRVLALSLLIGLPLVGVVLVGQPLEPYLEFPPQPRVVQPAPFSWPSFIGLALLILATVVPILLHLAASRVPRREAARMNYAFPWWGWMGLGLTGMTWILAWNRFPWFAALQSHTFTPLWMGYILILNGWTVRRTGHCMMLDRPRFFLALFPASAGFWWCFEYLNRFVQNWFYIGPHAFTPGEYFVHATLPFSTVLPSVLATFELLASMPRLWVGSDRLPPLRWSRSQTHWIGWMLLGVAITGLTAISIWPGRLFPLVWVAPLLLITALQMIAGQDTIFARIGQGDWTALWLAAVASLVCGFCWEMWNSRSLAHWEYAIPSVHRFKLFEMPLLGYAGYLPFGLECLAVTMFVFPDQYQEMIGAVMRTAHEAAGVHAPEPDYFKV